MIQDSAAGKTIKEVQKEKTPASTTEEMQSEAKGDLNHNRLLNFTRSCFTKDPSTYSHL